MIVLPWPDKRLTPNAKRRSHWRVYRDPAKSSRADANTLACIAVPLGVRRAVAASEGKIPIVVTFYPPDRRHRDDDGMIGAFKHQRDGIADAFGVDDNRFRPEYRFAEPCKPGRIEITVGPVQKTTDSSDCASVPACDRVEQKRPELVRQHQPGLTTKPVSEVPMALIPTMPEMGCAQGALRAGGAQ